MANLAINGDHAFMPGVVGGSGTGVFCVVVEFKPRTVMRQEQDMNGEDCNVKMC